MESLHRFIVASENPCLWKILLAAALIWFGVRLFFWILGAAGLYSSGRRRQSPGRFMAWIPFGQLWCEIRLTHHRRAARRAIPFLAAFAVFCAATVAALIWAFGGIGANLRTLAAAIAAAGALYCRIRLLALEFHSLRDYMDDPPIWKICLIFSFFGFPIQRIYLFINRNELD